MSDVNTQAETTQVEGEQVSNDTAIQDSAVQQEPAGQTPVEQQEPAQEPAVVATPVTQEVKKPAAAPVTKVAVKAATAPAAQTPASEEKLSTVVRLAFDSIRGYLEVMAPRRPLSVEEGCRNQVGLYRSITTIINRSEDDFQPAFAKLLKVFEDNAAGALSETHVFRFLDNVQLPEDDRRAFQRLVNLIKVLAPVKGRELAAKQIDFGASLKYGLTEQGRQRVLAFFGK